MARDKAEGKDRKVRRQRKRKARTEVASSSSDSEESNRAASPTPPTGQTANPSLPDGSTQEEIQHDVEPVPSRITEADPNNLTADFEAYYLRRIATEFAEDLNKIRTADDFDDDSLPILLSALKQGTGIFSTSERQTVLRAGKRNAAGANSTPAPNISPSARHLMWNNWKAAILRTQGHVAV
ncbi:hypothetical protein L228DRAFT_286402 [Xylona heveae TC161]|uniref:Ribosome assembly protein 3 n=1 Tax=Xylona heveae (strain CBS 132557 / TC161) TaxID=1328760 RepID=A0A164ZC06_XYLHT|nr:hypothetical protein L228DRAFT_286402 [Xylona heveae TC161]KZF18915.1 hypothetical protein L228DRAFT_286402 [Xylona heveae TC161]